MKFTKAEMEIVRLYKKAGYSVSITDMGYEAITPENTKAFDNKRAFIKELYKTLQRVGVLEYDIEL